MPAESTLEKPITVNNEPAGNERKEQPSTTLATLLEQLQAEGVKTLSPEGIKRQLEDVGEAIITRDFVCGIRMSRTGSKKSGYKYIVWMTNAFEDPNHPLTQKFGHKEISI